MVFLRSFCNTLKECHWRKEVGLIRAGKKLAQAKSAAEKKTMAELMFSAYLVFWVVLVRKCEKKIYFEFF